MRLLSVAVPEPAWRSHRISRRSVCDAIAAGYLLGPVLLPFANASSLELEWRPSGLTSRWSDQEVRTLEVRSP